MSCRKWEVQILRSHEGQLDEKSEATLVRHLETCAHCRNAYERFSEIDRLLLESREPSPPYFLNERIVSRVIEQMHQDAAKSPWHRFIPSFAYVRPALAGIILLVGVGLGVWTGLNLAHSITINSMGSSYDVLASSGIEGGRSDSSFDFIWADTNGGRR
jgi:anti-sigma factor RsiW